MNHPEIDRIERTGQPHNTPLQSVSMDTYQFVQRMKEQPRKQLTFDEMIRLGRPSYLKGGNANDTQTVRQLPAAASNRP